MSYKKVNFLSLSLFNLYIKYFMTYISNKHLRYLSNKYTTDQEVMDTTDTLKWFFEFFYTPNQPSRSNESLNKLISFYL